MSREAYIKKRDLTLFHEAKRKLGILPDSFLIQPAMTQNTPENYNDESKL